MANSSFLSRDVEQAIQQAINTANSALVPSDNTTHASSGNAKKRKLANSTKSNKKKHKSTTHSKSEQEGGFENVIVAGAPLPTATAPSDLVIDPSLMNIRSTLPTNQLADALTRAANTEGPVPSLTDLFGEDDSNENLLRVLSELDLPKVVGVLKNLSENSGGQPAMPWGASQLYGGGTGFEQMQHHRANSTETRSFATHLPTGVETTQPAAYPSARWNSSIPAATSDVGLDHTQLLSTRWLSTKRLGELERDEGLVYKKGKFSILEDNIIIQAVESYRTSKGLSEDEMRAVIKQKRNTSPSSEDTFWFDITAAVPMRPVISVYHHVRRMYDSQKHMGKWMPDEDAALESAVNLMGQRWADISKQVGRNANDCRDRWRNHLQHKNQRVTGHWSAEEEAQLTEIVRSLTIDQGLSADSDLFWTDIAAKLGNRRTRQQCRMKWTDSLNRTMKIDGAALRWGPQDAFILVYKVASLGVNDDSEIDWKNLNDADWNLWSAHQLQRRWKALKESIKGNEGMSFQDIVEILKAKKGTTPPLNNKPASGRYGRRPHVISSAEYIPEEDIE